MPQDKNAFLNRTNGKTKPQGFTHKSDRLTTQPEAKGDPRGNCEAARPAASTAIPAARTNALVLSSKAHEAMKALQSEGLGNAAAYVHRKTLERNAVVEKVSDAIAYLSDPDVLEADIMSAAAAKVAARSGAWGYAETTVDFDTLFALPATSQRLLGGT